MVDQATVVQKYFPNLAEDQYSRLAALVPLYKALNQKVNVISRKDIDNLTIRHVLHSLAIGAFYNFKAGTTIIDIGTGGGFPGIPLAIIFPDIQFTLIDGTGKKIRVATEVIEQIGLDNCKAIHQRAEYCTETYNYVVARAVTRLAGLVKLAFPLIHNKSTNALPNGLITLKGGTLTDEIAEVSKSHYIEEHALEKKFQEEYFKTKQLIYVQK